jgi:DNA-directed RNA polymerase subunit F
MLDPEESVELVEDLLELEKVDEPTAYKIADLLPKDRDELRSVYAQERYTLAGDELDDILNVVAKYD